MNRARWSLAGLLLLSLAGCFSLGNTTPPSRFFLLAAPELSLPETPGRAIRVLWLPTVNLPAYLDRPQLVTRRSAEELDIAPYARWGEPLATGITRLLRMVLAQHLPQMAVRVGMRTVPSPAALRLQVEVDRCEGDERDGRVHLQARWWLEDDSGNVLDRGRSDLEELWTPRDAAGLVAAHDRVLGRLAEELAKAVTASVGGNEPSPLR